MMTSVDFSHTHTRDLKLLIALPRRCYNTSTSIMAFNTDEEAGTEPINDCPPPPHNQRDEMNRQLVDDALFVFCPS